ncbi:LacI family DNA-binding transcriptional regulator [Kribbella solani]|uniref:DNA-binding LacI/PurR family transcriptional regulator n=1 Tax=Kribbella solani TaxID=236067 RepID=A0A841E267_9ACTN|nr:LacI family DNA-binding transcriptional regulator [Kribbella solani]MBB5983095.1 DNA-binding LacI/PurR family transcriptional regulator [Kribbella solani]MDX2971177.1 LacI family DNA-binding transcriptional regulator [Kribbella solani]MDX3000624.1 LacI family DNA-binding transcriptional regulator [Kribbella solani]
MAGVTLKTVAKAVGVSPSTVSNAYNKPDQLSVALRERILAAAHELGYAGPDAAARALRSGKAGAVGVLFTDKLAYAFSDPYAVGFLAGLAEVAEEFATSLLLMPLSSTDITGGSNAVQQAAIDAAAIFCVPGGHPALEILDNRGIPAVSTDRGDHPSLSWVAIDELEAAAQLGEHLARLGHREVVVLVDNAQAAGGRPVELTLDEVGYTDCELRIRGLQKTMPDARLRIVSGGHNAIASGRRGAEYALDSQDRPTAIVGLSDVQALGALEAMKVRGLTPGRDLTLAGFDDIPAAEAVGLTTVRQPIKDKGRAVGRILLDPASTERQLLLPTQLIVRSSSGPAPKR